DVVRNFFASMFKQQSRGDIGMRRIPAISAIEQLIHRLAAKTAALAVRQGEETGEAQFFRESVGIHALSCEAGDLGGTHARRQDQTDSLGGVAISVGKEVEREFGTPIVGTARP